MTSDIEKKILLERLNYSVDLTLVINRICTAYEIGNNLGFSVIPIGYEDCNIVISTDQGKYLAKIFANTRKPEDIERYSTIMGKALAAGVHHPPLLPTKDTRTVYIDREANGLSLVLMKFIEGQTFLDLDRAPNNKERKEIIEQAALINRIDYHPPYLFDSWAIPNIQVMFNKIKQFIGPEDLELVKSVIKRYEAIPVDNLPHCFVHGDFTKANVLKANNGQIYILDFAVANWYPRIQELAVIAANLLHDDSSKMSLREKTEHIAEEYSHFNLLTLEERLCLYDYALAGIAMEFMGSCQEKYINKNDTEETDYWFNLGRNGLREALVESSHPV